MAATARDRRLRRVVEILALMVLTSPLVVAEHVIGDALVGEASVDPSFRDFYRMPVGPRRLEPTGKPLALGELADGPADYLAGTTVFRQIPLARATGRL